MPSERMNGTGTKRSAPRPIATAIPENDDRPPRRLHRADDGILARAAPRELRAVAVHDEQGVVDRERQADEHDEVRDVGRHRRSRARARRRRSALPRSCLPRTGTGSARRRDTPRSATRMASAIGSAISSARRRSADTIGSRSCCSAGAPVTRAGGPRRVAERPPDVVRVTLRLLERERRRDVAVDDASAGAERARPGRRESSVRPRRGVARAPAARPGRRAARPGRRR